MKKVLSVFVTMIMITVILSSVSPVFAEERSGGNIYVKEGNEVCTEKYVRIHIRAKSNGEYDQQVKLRVRDSVINYLSQKLDGIETKQKALEILNENLTEIKRICDLTLYRYGADYTAQVMLGKESFPEKQYGELTLPADEYDALIITLHTGEGDNWWCIAYPPLCFIGGKENPDAPEEITYDSLIVRFFKEIMGK